MKSRIQSKIKIPGIAIAVIITIFIGLGAKGIIPILNHAAEKQQSAADQKNNPSKQAKSSALSSFGWIPTAASFSDYQAVVEYDLLKPLGWEKTVAKPPPPRPVVQREVRQERPAPANYLILTGIVYLGEEPIALVEDTASGKSYFLKEGDKLKDYLVEAIAEENIVLAKGDSKLMPALGSKTNYGSNDRGSISGMAVEQAKEDSIGDTDEKTASRDVAADNMSLIERLKARRRKELGQE